MTVCGELVAGALVTYTIEFSGRVIGIENVPARIDPETGEQLFSPETVERLQAIVWSGRQPDRVAQTPVFQFAASPLTSHPRHNPC